MRNELIILLEKHCDTVRMEAVEIKTCFEEFAPDSDDNTLQKAIFLVHKIKGSSGVLGFKNLSGAAHKLEYALRDLRAQEEPDLALVEIHKLSETLQIEVLRMIPELSSLHQSSVMAQT